MSAINRSIACGLITGALFLAALIGDAPTTAGAADPVMRIAFPSGMNGQIVVAMDKAGILQQSGLKAEFDSFQYGPPMMEALAAGSIDAAGTSLVPGTLYATHVAPDVTSIVIQTPP